MQLQYSKRVVLFCAVVVMLFGACSSDNAVAPDANQAGLTEAWVASSGDDGNTGAQDAPFATIQHAIDAIGPDGGTVHVFEGGYTETIELRSNVSLLGGYNVNDARRDPEANLTVIRSTAYRTIVGNGVESVTVDGFQILNDVASDGFGGVSFELCQSSTGVHLHSCTDVTISNNEILTARGRDGRDGSEEVARDGDDGRPGQLAVASQGGEGGVGGLLNPGGNGANGHGVVGDGDNGAPGQSFAAGGGAGGAGGVFADPNGQNGGDGGPSFLFGTNGQNGITQIGTADQDGYYPPSGATDGGEGGSGGGGGGGGSGAKTLADQFPNIFFSGGGGGGGEGGSGGVGGPRGTAGGASIGVLVSGNGSVLVENNTITTGNGGSGGNGATGGRGGNGGQGGVGAIGGAAHVGNGGNGGRGGDGRDGGSGGGGAGGNTAGIAFTNASGVDTGNAGNAYVVGNSGTGGFHGDGVTGRAISGVSAQFMSVATRAEMAKLAPLAVRTK